MSDFQKKEDPNSIDLNEIYKLSEKNYFDSPQYTVDSLGEDREHQIFGKGFKAGMMAFVKLHDQHKEDLKIELEVLEYVEKRYGGKTIDNIIQNIKSILNFHG